jgi:hypothetical protein
MEKKTYDIQCYPLQQETEIIIKPRWKFMILGAGFLEIV